MIDNFDRILGLIRNMNADWKDDLDRMGLWDNFYNLYALADDNKKGNILVGFVALAYNYRSDMIEISKDRLETKRRIMIKLGGLTAMDDKLLHDSAYGLNDTVNRVAGWYANDQKDWRWPDIISKIELHSRANALSAASLFPDSEVAKLLKEATLARKEAQEMWNDLRREYLPLDNALAAEGLVKLTDRMTVDFANWESYIRALKTEEKKVKDEEQAIRDKAKEIIKQQKDAEKLADKAK